MKRIGILSILILCLVVGGVYATWDYANANAVPDTEPVSVELATYSVEGNKGEIVQNSAYTNNMTIMIDDAQGNDHLADAVTGNGAVYVKFVASQTASAAVKSEGIIMQYYLSHDWALDSFTFKGTQVFTAVTVTPQDINSGAACPEATITGSEIAALITVNPALKLETIGDYNDLQEALKSYPFVINVEEKA